MISYLFKHPVYYVVGSAGAVEYTDCIYAEGWDLPLNECLGYDIKPSNGDIPASEIWGMPNIHSLTLLTAPLWPRVVAPDRVLSMAQIEQTKCVNKWVMLNCDCYLEYLKPFNCVQNRTQADLRMLSTKYVYKSHMY